MYLSNRLLIVGLLVMLGLVLNVGPPALASDAGEAGDSAELGPDGIAAQPLDGLIHACRSRYGSGQLRMVDDPGQCHWYEIKLSWAAAARFQDLEASVRRLEARVRSAEGRIQTLETDLQDAEARIEALEPLLTCLTYDEAAQTLRVEACNLQVMNGLGETDSANALGNLVIGYNEARGGGPDDRAGSHMLVIGSGHHYTYAARGGIVAGYNNTADAAYASVTGGENNRAAAHGSSVTGGQDNLAAGRWSSVIGGHGSEAWGEDETTVSTLTITGP